MTDTTTTPPPGPAPAAAPDAPRVTIAGIFLEFLLIGATSFGGGVVAYLRSGLVERRGWLDDRSFVELLGISQSLPGLNSTNMAILAGDRLRGAPGAAAAFAGVCLPGGLLMFLVGRFYQDHGNHPHAAAALTGVAAAAVGLVLYTAVELGRKSLANVADGVFVAVTVVAVNRLHHSVLTVLLVVGAVATLWYRPRPAPGEGGAP